MPTRRRPLHHVAYCVELDDLERTAEAFRATLAIEFDELVRPDLGLHILIAWLDGIELVAPLPEPGRASARARSFLDEHGPGVLSVVAVVEDLDAAVARAESVGASVLARQSESDAGAGLRFEEASIELPLGLPLTLLETNLP
jgi:hypothetical protein